MDRALQALILAAIVAMAVASCKAPTVNLATSEPIKVDIDMRLDVYQYGSTNAPKTGQVTVTKAPDADQLPPSGTTSTNLLSTNATSSVKPANPEMTQSRRRDRAADIQKFKNERMVGEGHDGLLFVVKGSLPQNDYGHFVRTTVNAENEDRMDLMKKMADEQKVSLPTIEAKQGEIRKNSAFKGEWIETQQPDGTWKPVEKEG